MRLLIWYPTSFACAAMVTGLIYELCGVPSIRYLPLFPVGMFMISLPAEGMTDDDFGKAIICGYGAHLFVFGLAVAFRTERGFRVVFGVWLMLLLLNITGCLEVLAA
jgi:hypothetical protein